MGKSESRREWEIASAGQGVVECLETCARQTLGVSFAVAVSSGTSALHAALWAGGVGSGDEVICSALDWYAAAAVTLHLGAVPVFADVDPWTYTITSSSVEQRVTDRTRAVVATHLFGHPADMAAIQTLTKHRGLLLVEDAAQALGASDGERMAGALGDIGCVSLGPGKAVEAGGGGLIVTDREDLWERVLAFCQHPLRQRLEGIGMFNPFSLNSRMPYQTAAEGVRVWAHLSERIAERRERLAIINQILAAHPQLYAIATRPGCVHAAYQLCPRLRSGATLDTVRGVVPRGFLASACPMPYVPAALLASVEDGVWARHPAIARVRRSARRRCPVAEGLYDGGLACLSTDARDR